MKKTTAAGGFGRRVILMHHCPLVRRARLISHKALALSGLALAAMLFSTPAAQAGHWQFACTGSGSSKATYGYPGSSPYTVQYVPPTATQRPNMFDALGIGGSTDRYTTSYVATITVTLTATWTHDSGQTDANDPAPTGIVVNEVPSANWTAGTSGTLVDDFKDPTVPTPGGVGEYISIPKAHYTTVQVNGKLVD